MYTVQLSKESFKFSAAHFTVFDQTRSERLHGHNYYVSVRASFKTLDAKTAMTVDFAELKKDIQTECDTLDEYVLLPSESVFLDIQQDGKSITAKLAEKTYVLPKSDVRLLPLSNITCEGLSQLLSERLKQLWAKMPSLQGIEVTIEETRGQSVSRFINVESSP